MAQLVAQNLDLGKLNKEDHYVDLKNQDALLSRIDIILVWSKADNGEQSTTICTIDNIWHDFIKPDHININLDNMFEEFKNTCGER